MFPNLTRYYHITIIKGEYMEKTIEQELKELGFEMKDREDDILFDDTESRKNHWIEYFTYKKNITYLILICTKT